MPRIKFSQDLLDHTEDVLKAEGIELTSRATRLIDESIDFLVMRVWLDKDLKQISRKTFEVYARRPSKPKPSYVPFSHYPEIDSLNDLYVEVAKAEATVEGTGEEPAKPEASLVRQTKVRTVSDAFREWLTDSDAKQKQIDIDQGMHDRHIGPLIGDLPIGQVDEDVIKGLQRDILRKANPDGGPTLAATAKRCRQIVESIFENDPEGRQLNKRKIGPKPKTRKGTKTPDVHDLPTIWREAPPVMKFIMLSGFRITEVAGLRWEQIDLKRKTVTFDEQKSGPGHRCYPLCPMQIKILKEQKKLGSEWCFPVIDRANPISKKPSKKEIFDAHLLKADLKRMARKDAIAYFPPSGFRPYFLQTAEHECGIPRSVAEQMSDHALDGSAHTQNYVGRMPTHVLRPHHDAVAAKILEHCGL